ncbi:LysE family translocator [Paraferrimonas sp. SM1919]|uniref:LysE family translocator n=1 Tax=Paraferrimonas sp. SM1919 TaxID=2662263 RepID=UPI0013D6371C|nr:LysE family translocator [Paraferrimonas sp. SM1919]
MTFLDWLPLAVVCLLGAMSPGPSLALVARHTLASGRLHGVVCSWAHALGIGVYALMSVLGLHVLMQQYPLIFQVISALGGGYLIWIGCKAILAKQGIAQSLAAGKVAPLWRAGLDGLVMSLLSPKIMLFFVALFSQFVAQISHSGNIGTLVITPLMIDGLWYTLVVLLLSQSWLLPKLRQQAQILDKLSGILLLGLGLNILYQVMVLWLNFNQ